MSDIYEIADRLFVEIIDVFGDFFVKGQDYPVAFGAFPFLRIELTDIDQ